MIAKTPEAHILKSFYPLQLDVHLGTKGKPLVDLDALFELNCSYIGSFSCYVEALISTQFWKKQQYENNPFPLLCIELANAIDQYNKSLPYQPPYHSLQHFEDVCLALSLLLKTNHDLEITGVDIGPWKINQEKSWLLLFCAISHDYGHTGTTNTKAHEIEIKTINLIKDFLNASKVDSKFYSSYMRDIESLILATDFQFFPDLIKRLSMKATSINPKDCMAMLLVESDLMASALPQRGQKLGTLLSLEWETTNPIKSTQVSSKAGRIAFLERIAFFSPQSRALGITQLRQDALNQLRSSDN
jgi:hypothetical protein